MLTSQVFTPNLAVTFTSTPLAGLANGATATSDYIDNSVNGFLSGEFQISFETGTVSGSPIVTMYILRAVEGSSSGPFDDADVNNAELLRQISTPTSTHVYTTSVRLESLPQYYQIMVVNNTGAALGGTASLKYVGKSVQVT